MNYFQLPHSLSWHSTPSRHGEVRATSLLILRGVGSFHSSLHLLSSLQAKHQLPGDQSLHLYKS